MICLADFGNINSLSDSSAVDTMIDNAFISRARKPETSDLIDNICQIAILAQSIQWACGTITLTLEDSPIFTT